MRAALLLAFLLFLPSAAFALQINEIMYDLPGSDAGREWVEVYQESDGCADLAQWKFFEANTNHGITLFQGEPAICSGGYAVLADDAEKFLVDHPDFSGSLFDSAFSLSNTGETLALKNPDGNITNSISYSSAWGANGNGRSLERNGSGWFESLVNATPGILNSIFMQPPTQEQPQNENKTDQNTEPVVQQGEPSAGAPSNYSPLIDFSIIGRSNRVPQGSAIETVLSARSNYLIVRNVEFCTYAKSEVLASDEACQSVELAPDEAVELHLYNTLKANVSGSLALVAELRDGVSVKQKTAVIEVLSQSTAESKVSAAAETPKGPTAAFAAKSDGFSRFIAWLKNLFALH